MLLVVGVNEKGATVHDRERLAVAPDHLPAVLRELAALDGVDEVLLLSTCYRVEAYAASSRPDVGGPALRRALARRAGRADLPLFELHGAEALRHLVRVAASLESAVVGEPQILGQVKDAHHAAAAAGTAGRELAGVLDRVYAAAKRVRTESAIGRAGVSWGSAATTLAEKVLGPVAGKHVVVVGAGEMARVSAQHLREQGAELTVLNRTASRGEELAAELQGTFAPLETLEEQLRSADVVVVAAGFECGALEPARLGAAMRARRGRDLVVVDLAVPRAVPVEAGAVEGVYLCDVDDLARLTARAREERTQAIADAERIVAAEIARFEREQVERRAAPVIQAMRRHAAEIAREEVDRTARRIGADPEVEERLAALANAVVSKLLHHPSTQLRQAATDAQRGERLITAAVEIFGLPLDGGSSAARG